MAECCEECKDDPCAPCDSCEVTAGGYWYTIAKVYWNAPDAGPIKNGDHLYTWEWSGAQMVPGRTDIAEFTNLTFTDIRNPANDRTVTAPLGSDQNNLVCAESNITPGKNVLTTYPPFMSGGIGEDQGNEIESGNLKYDLS